MHEEISWLLGRRAMGELPTRRVCWSAGFQRSARAMVARVGGAIEDRADGNCSKWHSDGARVEVLTRPLGLSARACGLATRIVSWEQCQRRRPSTQGQGLRVPIGRTGTPRSNYIDRSRRGTCVIEFYCTQSLRAEEGIFAQRRARRRQGKHLQSRPAFAPAVSL
jgi:hypothetical protein